MDEQSLAHYGIKGQKWGIRRFQNADGTLTEDGRKHYGVGDSREKSSKGLTDSQKTALKNVGKAALIAGSVAAAGYLYTKNSAEINDLLKETGFWSYQYAKAYAKQGNRYMKNLAKQSLKQAKEGAKEAIKEVPKDLGKAAVKGAEKVALGAVEGAAIIAAKKFLEATEMGEEFSDSTRQAYNAYNKKKKIGQVNGFSRKDDDDDD